MKKNSLNLIRIEVNKILFFSIFLFCSSCTLNKDWETLESLEVGSIVTNDNFNEYTYEQKIQLKYRTIDVERAKTLMKRFEKTKKDFLWFGKSHAIAKMQDGRVLNLEIGLLGGVFKVVETGDIYIISSSSIYRDEWDSLIFPNGKAQ